MLKLMSNFQVFQTIYHTNFCISTGIKTTANFLITDIETTSFFASHCKFLFDFIHLFTLLFHVFIHLFTLLFHIFIHLFTLFFIRVVIRLAKSKPRNCFFSMPKNCPQQISQPGSVFCWNNSKLRQTETFVVDNFSAYWKNFLWYWLS